MAGWLWTSSSSSDDSDSTPESTQATSTPSTMSEPTRTPNPPNPPKDTSPTARVDQLSRDETALEELKAAFASSLPSTDDTTHPTPTTTTTTTTPPHTQPLPPPTPPSDSLYPTTLSCAQCFDSAYYCSSVGGQLNSLYRYGAMRSCSDLWAQWRFCMRTKTMGEEERKRRVWEWNREKEVRRRVGRNSEEVWGLRTEGAPEGALGIWEGRGEEGGKVV